MKTIFSEIYNKILELFQIEKAENSSDYAANRLQVILMHDRTKLDPLIMGKMREELINVFSKYVVIDKEKLEIDLRNQGDAAALMLNIPIVRAKTEAELEELRKQLKSQEEKVIDDDAENADYIIVEEIEEENSAETEKSDKAETEENTPPIENSSGENANQDAAQMHEHIAPDFQQTKNENQNSRINKENNK